jgi:hypothetical protein
MNVTRTSMLDGSVNTLDLNVSADQLNQYAGGGAFIQDVFPELPPAEREFIKTGITPAQWEDEFGF